MRHPSIHFNIKLFFGRMDIMKKNPIVRVIALVLLLTTGLLLLSLPTRAAPSVSAKSAILMEAEGRTVLYQQNAFVRMPMASTTKIMTALVVIESGNVKRTVSIPKEATGIEGSSVYLYPEEQLTVEELLYALLLESANDAATALAIAVAGSVEAFAARMNQKAEALGLTATHFVNPHGLDDDEHYTTAYDLAVLTAYALENETFRTICATARKTIPLKGDEGTRVLVNHNKMLTRYEGAMGVKTGFTKKSGRCLVSAAERDGLTLIAVTLSAPDDWNDHAALLDFGFSNYARATLAEENETLTSLSVSGGEAATISVATASRVSVMLRRGAGEVTLKIEAAPFLVAPVKQGATVGRAVWICDGREIASVPLVATEDVPCKKAERKGLWTFLTSLFDRE